MLKFALEGIDNFTLDEFRCPCWKEAFHLHPDFRKKYEEFIGYPLPDPRTFCRGAVLIRPGHVRTMQLVRSYYDTPIEITCGSRCWSFHVWLYASNSETLLALGRDMKKPYEGSKHMTGDASDWKFASHKPPVVKDEDHQKLKEFGVSRLGVGKGDTWYHTGTFPHTDFRAYAYPY